jgi:hypothetical protein
MGTDLNSLIKIVMGHYQEILEVLGENNITIAQFIGLIIGLYGIWEKIKPEVEPDPEEDPIEDPEPIVDPIEDPIYDPIVACDLEQIPNMIRKDLGLDARDTVCWWSLFSTYGDHEWVESVTGDDPESAIAWNMRDKFAPWFTKKIDNVISQLKKKPSFKVLVIANDGNDRGGCFLVEPIIKQLISGGISTDRIIRGDILYY